MNYSMIIALFNLVNLAIVIYQKRIRIIIHPHIHFTTSGTERRMANRMQLQVEPHCASLTRCIARCDFSLQRQRTDFR